MYSGILMYIIVANAVGFVTGAGLTLLLLQLYRHLLVNGGKPLVTIDELQVWSNRNTQLRELNLKTREILDKIEHAIN